MGDRARKDGDAVNDKFAIPGWEYFPLDSRAGEDRAIVAVLDDLLSRSGFDAVWDGCDKVTKSQIVRDLQAKVAAALNDPNDPVGA